MFPALAWSISGRQRSTQSVRGLKRRTSMSYCFHRSRRSIYNYDLMMWFDSFVCARCHSASLPLYCLHCSVHLVPFEVALRHEARWYHLGDKDSAPFAVVVSPVFTERHVEPSVRLLCASPPSWVAGVHWPGQAADFAIKSPPFVGNFLRFELIRHRLLRDDRKLSSHFQCRLL